MNTIIRTESQSQSPSLPNMGGRTSTQLGATDDSIFNPFTYQAQLSTCPPSRPLLKPEYGDTAVSKKPLF